MEPLADQIDAAIRAAEGYSEMAGSFHPELRERVRGLVGEPRQFPKLELYGEELLPAPLGTLHRELVVRVAARSPAPYLVWARYPDLNWPVPLGYTAEKIARLLAVRFADRCNWCSRDNTEATDVLLVSAGCAIAMFSFCRFCRIALDEECRADLAWVEMN